jgi:hypothetical protein
MSPIASLWRRVRQRVLEVVNTRICRRTCEVIPPDLMPSYIVVTPHLLHLAPLAARHHGPHIQPVFVANGLDATDVAWLSSLCPEVPLAPLVSTLTGNKSSVLEHGFVINYLAAANGRAFCIQDADCFVSEPAFWDTVTLNLDTEYASGPFVRKGCGDGPDFPDTFLLCLNWELLRRYRRTYDISAESAARPRSRARHFLETAGYPEGRYLESLKSYYDTLQQFWVAAQHHGYHYRVLPGDGETVRHVGGTSYLFRAFDDVMHWDYWPLNVHYFHLRLLDLPGCTRFRARFETLLRHHGSSDRLLANHPEFAEGWRRRQSDLILDTMGAASLYGHSA